MAKTAKAPTVATTQPKPTEKKDLKLTGEVLISFISGAQTNIGRATFYNLAKDQQQAMIDQHLPILKEARPFYSLMMLPPGINDVNRQLIAWNLIEQTIREDGLKPHEHSPTTKWENEIILQSLDTMPVPRVLDFFVHLKDEKISSKRAKFVVYEYLRKHRGNWDLWTIKYRYEMKVILRYIHISYNQNSAKRDPYLAKLMRYLEYGEKDGCGQLILDYEDVRNGDKSKLAKLPLTIAEGFSKKLEMKKEDLTKKFVADGGKLTAKEKQTRTTSMKEMGIDSGFDLRKAKLFDSLVYLKSLDRLPSSEERILETLRKKATDIAKSLNFEFQNVGLILDTSMSMAGTKQQPFHPLLRAMALSLVLEQVSKKFKVYRTNESTSFFPRLANQSNYADAVLKALNDGCKTIIIVGDGYENAPFEGATHALLFAYKNKLDKENKLMVLHFNPVFAAETMDVRPISEIASFIGLRDVEAISQSMFLALAKQKPMLAIKNYFGYLVGLQSQRAKELMPPNVLQLANSETKLLD
jgi:hypothetical protein